MKNRQGAESGVTIVELMVTLFVVLIICGGFLVLYTALLHSTILAKRKAVGLSLATNQMEYLRSLPYANLAVAGGSIISNSYIPATTTQTINGLRYTITTEILYVDDAYDGCGSYPNPALKARYCRGYSSSTPATTDTNAADYKIADINVTDSVGEQLAYVDSEFSARVAETASSTGAMFITVVDSTGAPLADANVQVTNSNVTPAVNANITTDAFGVAIFYNLPSDSNGRYVEIASKNGYSTLNTIAPNGSLQPTYANLSILNQQSSAATLVLKKQATPSLLIQTTSTSGSALAGVKVYIKGGYKSYTTSADTTYYYDNLSGGDNRPTSDGSGMISLNNLVPGPYYFCGDNGSSSCTIGSTTYYLAAAVPYSGSTALNPLVVPIAGTNISTYPYGGNSYIQQVQLMLTTNPNFPRVSTLTPSVANLSSGSLSSFSFSISGNNLSGASVSFTQGGSNFPASCSGSSTQISCSVNLTGAGQGNTQLVITNAAGTLTLPGAPELGGILVEP